MFILSILSLPLCPNIVSADLDNFPGKLWCGKRLAGQVERAYSLNLSGVKVMESSPHELREITRILREWSDGKQEALDSLLPLVYAELHRQAARYLRRERRDHTLQTTALVHEA